MFWLTLASVAVVLLCVFSMRLYIHALETGFFVFRGKRRVAIADAVDNEVVIIKGTVETDDIVSSPCSQTPCAVSILEISREEVVGTGSSATRTWIPFVHNQESHGFVVVDDAGHRAHVDGSDLRLYVQMDRRIRLAAEFPDESMLAFLKSRGIDAAKKFTGSRFQVREGVIEVGQQVTVCGLARWETDSGEMAVGGYRGALPKRLRITGVDGRAVIVRDR